MGRRLRGSGRCDFLAFASPPVACRTFHRQDPDDPLTSRYYDASGFMREKAHQGQTVYVNGSRNASGGAAPAAISQRSGTRCHPKKQHWCRHCWNSGVLRFRRKGRSVVRYAASPGTPRPADARVSGAVASFVD